MMSDERTKESSTVRKVYVLPRELVERISAFQKAKRLPSEVEAVRRLLDEALLTRDNDDAIITRIKDKLKSDGMVSSVAKDVLVGHPLVSNISFPSHNCVQFSLKSGERFRVTDDGTALEWLEGDDKQGRWTEFVGIPF